MNLTSHVLALLAGSDANPRRPVNVAAVPSRGPITLIGAGFATAVCGLARASLGVGRMCGGGPQHDRGEGQNENGRDASDNAGS